MLNNVLNTWKTISNICSTSNNDDNGYRPGVIDISTLTGVQRRHADLKPKVEPETRAAVIRQPSVDPSPVVGRIQVGSAV